MCRTAFFPPFFPPFITEEDSELFYFSWNGIFEHIWNNVLWVQWEQKLTRVLFLFSLLRDPVVYLLSTGTATDISTQYQQSNRVLESIFTQSLSLNITLELHIIEFFLSYYSMVHFYSTTYQRETIFFDIYSSSYFEDKNYDASFRLLNSV